MSSSKLTDLVPSTPYALAYTLPLLLISILLLFAGSFLTLDRTRSFAPTKDVLDYSTLPGTFEAKRKRRFSWLFEGGVGGLAIGYAFGVHLSTLLALLIPATTSSAVLSPKSFVAVWILSCIPTTVLAGRFRHAALLFAGIMGGFTLALGLALILHPALLPRQILLGVFSILFTVLLFLCNLIPRLSPFLRAVLRTASASLGAFGLVVSIALLTHPPVLGWADVWERLWLQNGDPSAWGTNKEKALSAAWAIFCVFGILGDWGLNRWVGECPDEKWDSYLSKYVLDPPNYADRAGTFRPLVSVWDRLLGKGGRKGGVVDDDKFFLGPQFNGIHGSNDGEKGDIIFPSDRDLKRVPLSPPQVDAYYSIPPPKPTSPAFKLLSKKSTRSAVERAPPDDFPHVGAFLRKKKTNVKRKDAGDRRKKPIRFGSMEELSSSDSSDEEKDDTERDGVKQDGSPKDSKPKRPWIITNQHSSYSSDVSTAPTLVDGKRSTPATPAVPPLPSPVIKGREREPPQEADVVDIDYDKELERLQSQLSLKQDDNGRRADYFDNQQQQQSGPPSSWSPAFLQRHPPPPSQPHPQQDERYREDAYDSLDLEGNAREVRGDRTPPPRWDDFWKEVRAKAAGTS